MTDWELDGLVTVTSTVNGFPTTLDVLETVPDTASVSGFTKTIVPDEEEVEPPE